MIDFVAGFLSAWTLRSLLEWRRKHRGGNIGTTPLVRNEGRAPDWRRSINHENTNAPSGPPPLNLRRSKPVRLEEGRLVTVQGLNWPATLGDFTLVGPADNQGAWRWYERQRNGTTERVKVDHQLQPLGPPHLGEP